MSRKRLVNGRWTDHDESVILPTGKVSLKIHESARLRGEYGDEIPKGKRVGRPRKDASGAGVHLILFPTFWNWLRLRRPDLRPQWDALADKARFFLVLACAAMPKSPTRFASQRAAAPVLFDAALPMLRRRAQKITVDDYKAACGIYGYGVSGKRVTMTARARDKARNARKALEIWRAVTEQKPTN